MYLRLEGRRSDNMTKSLARALAPRIRVVSIFARPGSKTGIHQVDGTSAGAMSSWNATPLKETQPSPQRGWPPLWSWRSRI